MSVEFQMPMSYLPLPDKDKANSLGSLYIGLPNGDPVNPPEQKAVFRVRQNDTSIQIAQPISIGVGGMPMYNGSPVELEISGAYSMKVLDRFGAQIYYAPYAGKVGEDLDSLNASILNIQGIFVKKINTVAELRTTTPTYAFQQFSLLGHTAPGIGGGIFYYAGTVANTSSDNNGTVIVSSVGGIFYQFKRANYTQLSTFMFGLIGDGVTDETAKMQIAVNAAAGSSLLLDDTANSYVIGDVIVPSNITIFGANRTTAIKLANPNANGFKVISKDSAIFRDFTIIASGIGTTNLTAGININASINCEVDGVDFDGFSAQGVLLYDSNDCVIYNCTFRNWVGTINDSADVLIYNNSNRNHVANCGLFGGGDHGCLIQSPYTDAMPMANKVTGCYVSAHKAYGLVAYNGVDGTPTLFDSRTVFANNHIYDIIGSAVAGASGSGIYIQSMGGTIISGNEVWNCNTATTNFETQASACISVVIGEYATTELYPVTVDGNNVTSTRGPCVVLSTSNCPITLSGCSLRNNSTANVRGEALRVFNSDSVTMGNLSIEHKNTNFAAISIVASNKIVRKAKLSNIDIKTVSTGISFDIIGTGTHEKHSLSNVTIEGGNANAFFANKVTKLKLVNCDFESSGDVIQINACPGTKITQTDIKSNGAGTRVYFVGTNTDSLVDESCSIVGGIENSGTGLILRQYGTGTIAAYRAVGDTIIQRTPVVGQPKQWRVTVAGASPTWVSEGNL